MSVIIGREIEFGVGVEEDRGTPQGTPERWLKKIQANVVPRAAHAVDESTHGRLEDSDQRRVVQLWSEGDLSGNIHADALGYLLYNIFGAVTPTSLGSGAYRHDFSLAQNTSHPSLTLFVKDGDVDQMRIANAMLSALTIEAAPDAFVSFSASFMGKQHSSNAASPSYSTEYDFIGRDVTVKFADTEGGLAAATPIKAKSLTLNFEPNVEANYVLGNYSPDDIYNKQWSITGEYEEDYSDTDARDRYLDDSNKYMQITIQGAANIGGGANPKLVVIMNKVQLMDWNRADGANDIVTQTVSFKAFYRAADTESATASLTNNTPEYDEPISA